MRHAIAPLVYCLKPVSWDNAHIQPSPVDVVFHFDFGLRGLILGYEYPILHPCTNFDHDLGTTTPHSKRSEPRPSQFRPLTIEATARKQSFSSPSREAPTSSKTWRSSMRSVKRTKRLPTSFRKSPKSQKPTEFEIQTPRCFDISLQRLRCEGVTNHRSH